MPERKRLDVMVRAEVRDALDQQAQQQGRTLTAVAEEYLVAGLARYRGEMIEQQSLPVIREILQTELRKTAAEMRLGVREDIEAEVVPEVKAMGRRSDDRLAALLVK